MSQKRAIICGYYGRGNAGDEALLASVLQMLPPHVEAIVLSANPQQTSDRFGVRSCPHRSTFEILQTLRSADYFLWGGGSLMQDATSLASPIYYGGLMALAQQYGLKTVAWAQGIGPLNHPLTRWITRRTLQKCTAVSVRDRATAQLVADWKLSVILAPDPVWALESKPPKGLWELPAPRVAVTLRAHPQLTPQRLNTFKTALVNFQKATQTYVLLVPFQPEKDTAIARELAAAIPEHSRILHADDPRETKGIFRGVDFAIGMRLHSLIMAAAEECLCYAIGYDPKIDRLMAELDLPGVAIADLPDDPHQICKTWLEHYANGSALSPAQIQSLSDRALLHRELLADVLT